MRRALIFFSFLFVVLVALAGGCAESITTGGAGGDSPSDVGSIIVGVTSDLRVDVDIDQLHVQRWVGDKKIQDEVLTTKSAPSPLRFPAEFPFLDVAAGELVKIQLEAFRVGDATTPIVSRLASTRVVFNKKLLLRVPIDARCMSSLSSSAPVCAAPETCIAGACGASLVESKTLPTYTEAWIKVKNDTCKAEGGGAPIVTVGEGQADYLPTSDLDEAQVEAGPQGGHHIWIAVRIKNLLQSGSITRVTGRFADLDLDIRPLQVIFTFDQDEGGFCKLYGMRFQLDQEHDIQDLLGRVLTVKVQVSDKDGDVGVGERAVTLSKEIL